jgi:hypothetical protein
MKLADLFNRLDETLDKPLSYTHVNQHSYEITLPSGDTLKVMVYERNALGYKCASILFMDPTEKEPYELTNKAGNASVRVLSTIMAIIDKLDYDMLIILPSDIKVEISQKKLRLYRSIATKMQMSGKLAYFEVINIDEMNDPILVGIRSGSKAARHNLPPDQIAEVLYEFGYTKQGE